jgi:hypothetical protein
MSRQGTIISTVSQRRPGAMSSHEMKREDISNPSP